MATRIFSRGVLSPLVGKNHVYASILGAGAMVTGSSIMLANVVVVKETTKSHETSGGSSIGLECNNRTENPISLAATSSQHNHLPRRILATSPLSAPINSSSNNDTDTDTDYPSNARWGWWTLRWWGFRRKSRSTNQSTWLQRIKRTFFVITRGLEIVVRLSPLLVLTPTAMVISYFHPPRDQHPSLIRYGNNNNNSRIVQLPNGNNIRDENDDDDLFVHQFEEPRNQQIDSHHIHSHIHTNWASNLAWKYTLHTLQSLGPAFVKLGQWAATRRDLFPVHVCNRLSDLHDMAKTHEWRYTHDALVEAFGDYESRGLRIQGHDGKNCNDLNGIIGSGSAAQVHRGTLTTSSSDSSDKNVTRMVAIKVLHPNTRFLVERDLALMQYTADIIDQFIPLEVVKMLSLPRAVANFSDVMRRQVDLRIEGENLHIFRENFGCINDDESDKHGKTSSARSFFAKKQNAKSTRFIEFPKPEEGWVSEKVLVEAHAGDDAIPISHYLADDSLKGLEIRRQLAGPLLRAFLKMVFLDNFVHADLHPGNVLVREILNENNSQKVHYTIIFLDAGIAISLKENDRKNLRDLFRAVVLNDGYNAGELMVERARYEKCTSIPGGKHAFASGVSAIVSEFHDRRKQGLTLGAVRVGTLLTRVLDLCRRYGVEIDPAMASVVVSMLVLEGLGRSLDPNLNLMKAAMPFLLKGGAV